MPGFALVYLIDAKTRSALAHNCCRPGLRPWSRHGWWVHVVASGPRCDRPYVGGSPGQHILDLIFGYNGFAQITTTSKAARSAAAGQARRARGPRRRPAVGAGVGAPDLVAAAAH